MRFVTTVALNLRYQSCWSQSQMEAFHDTMVQIRKCQCSSVFKNERVMTRNSAIKNNEVLTLKKYSKLEETGSRSVTFSKSALIDKSSRTIVDIDRYWLRFEAGRHFGSGASLQAKFHRYPSRGTKRLSERSLPSWHLTHELRNRPTNSLDVLLVDSVRMTVPLVES